MPNPYYTNLNISQHCDHWKIQCELSGTSKQDMIEAQVAFVDDYAFHTAKMLDRVRSS